MVQRTTLAISALFALSGCTGPVADSPWLEIAPLGRAISGPTRGTSRNGPRPSVEEPAGPLTLPRALELAFAGNPGFAAESWRVRAAEARIAQADVRPNPEIEFEIEEFGGSGEASGFGASTATLALGQEIELGGKRRFRTRAAALEARLAAWDHEARRLDLIAETRLAFTEVLAAQLRVALAEDSVGLAERTRETVRQRVEAGKVSPLDAMQVEVDLARSRVDLARERRALDAAREQLAAMWGATTPRFERADGALEGPGGIPPLEALLAHAERNPDVARWQDEMALRMERLGLERANRIPNLDLRAGVQRLGETDDTAFVVGLAMPLAVSDRNRGGVLEAEREISGAEEERKASELKVTTELRRAYHELTSELEEAASYADEVLPAARHAFEAAQEGYHQGKFGYLEVLGSQKALFEARREHIEALASCGKALAEVERLAGTPPGAVGRTVGVAGDE